MLLATLLLLLAMLLAGNDALTPRGTVSMFEFVTELASSKRAATNYTGERAHACMLPPPAIYHTYIPSERGWNNSA